MRQAVTVMKAECLMKKWNVKAGDQVHKGDLLCTVVVGKLNREVASKYDGTVLEIAIQEEAVPAAPASEAPSQGEPAGLVALAMPKTGGPSTVKKWYKKPGEPVKAGEAVVAVTAGKLNRDVNSPCGGTLDQVLVQEGGSAQPGDTLGWLKASAAPAAAPAQGAPEGLVAVVLPKAAGNVATLKKWLKQPGDRVAPGEAVAAVVAGKLNVDVTRGAS